MSCILRAWGRHFDADSFLLLSPLPQDTVYEAAAPLTGGGREDSAHHPPGLNVRISEAGAEDLDVQIDEAIGFLDRYEEELRRLGSFSGVEAVTLEFGLPWREAFAQTETFPSELLWRAGALDISLQITHYSTSAPS